MERGQKRVSPKKLPGMTSGLAAVRARRDSSMVAPNAFTDQMASSNKRSRSREKIYYVRAPPPLMPSQSLNRLDANS